MLVVTMMRKFSQTDIVDDQRDSLDVYTSRQNICSDENLSSPVPKRINDDISLSRFEGAC